MNRSKWSPEWSGVKGHEGRFRTTSAGCLWGTSHEFVTLLDKSRSLQSSYKDAWPRVMRPGFARIRGDIKWNVHFTKCLLVPVYCAR